MSDPTAPASPPPDPCSATNQTTAAAATAEALPLLDTELRDLLRHPERALPLLLGERARLAATIGGQHDPWRLCLLLLVVALVASAPFGCVLSLAATWKVAVLFGGSVLLCWPSLQVFSSYLGGRLLPAQSLALSLVIACVAALFTLGFSPIQWFLQATMSTGDHIDATTTSCVLLAVSMLAGLAQLLRCAIADRRLAGHGTFVLLLAWQAVVVFVTLRMARALALIP